MVYIILKTVGLLLGTLGRNHPAFVNDTMGLVFKVRDPFAKGAIKGTRPCDVIYEHIVHNMLFPNTHYSFVGVGDVRGDVRIILSQPFIFEWTHPSQDEIDAYMASIGLSPDGLYFYGNEYVAITDISQDSDNVLKDNEGHLFFIDPLIKLKRPAIELINANVIKPDKQATEPSKGLFHTLFGKK